MLTRMPTTAFPLSLFDIISSSKAHLVKEDFIRQFEHRLAHYIGVKHAFLVDSGTAAFYLVIKAFYYFTAKKEVVLPAYTVPTLTLAINRAGLKTKLCEIDTETLNLDPRNLARTINNDTLCIVPVHMFGLPCALDPIRTLIQDRNIFLFEDACQAPGAKLDGKMVGGIGDAGFFSLCKGKNISAFNGGIATTNSDDLAERIRSERALLPHYGKWNKSITVLKLIALSLAMKPLFYKILYPLIAPFKSTTVHTEFDPHHYTDFQAVIGRRLLEKLDAINRVRIKNASVLIETLRSFDSVIIPKIIHGAEPVFNHLPVVIKHRESMQPLRKALWEVGIDSARMYERPIHRIYDLGYILHPDPFPEATYVAERLITLPTHPWMGARDLAKIYSTFKRILSEAPR